MLETADIVIIGAGINGTSLAFHLAKERPGKIVVLEKSQVSAGATGKSGGLIRCNYTNEPEARLALESLKYFENWEDMVGGRCGFQQVGLLTLVPPEKLSNLAHNVEWQQKLGIATRVISRDEAREIDPSIQIEESISHVAYESTAGYADANATNYAFVSAAQRLGVEFRLGTEVNEILHRNGQIIGVSTTQGIIHSSCVVVVAGAWANQLFEPLGLNLGLVPTLSRICIFRWTPERSERHPTYIDHTQRTWYRPTAESCTLIGAETGIKRAPDLNHWSESVSQPFIQRCRDLLVHRFPVMQGASTRGNWACVFMNSPDSRPLIGALPQYTGLFTVAGDSGTSFKTAPAIGKSLSELIVYGHSRTVDLSPFRPTRFAEGEVWKDRYNYNVKQATISR
jgi:sarcosine oxidase subunit beta